MDSTNSLSDDFADLSVNELTQVSPKRDCSTEEDHNLLDEELLETFSAFRIVNREPQLHSLLTVIAANDNRLVTLTRQEANDLLTSHPSITRVLRKAWENKSFKEVRQLNILWPVVQETTKRSHKPSNKNADLTAKALRSAWHDTYIGNNHQLLFDNINAIPRTHKPYSNQIAIVQSSGTGKSRMVHEQSNLVFTIPFNLRDKGDNRDMMAFPTPDDAVHDYLVKASVTNDQHILKTNYLKFLGNVFRLVNGELDKCHDELREKQITTAEGLAKWWSNHLQGIRTELYKAAIDGTSEAIETLPEIQKKHEELLAKRRPKPEDSEDFDHTDYNMKAVVEYAAAEAARRALGELICKLDSWVEPQTERMKLVVYFDETHPLKVVPKNEEEKTLYDFLCSCLNQFLTFPMFCIFLSTNPSLVQFAPPRALPESARILVRDAETHAPITETPFDCCEDLMVKPGQLKLEHTSTIQFMAQFGRPLFWTLLRGAGVTSPQVRTEILELAREKLVASRKINSTLHNFSRAARLAVLDVQLSLDFEPRREKAQIEEANLVESHMRIAYSIPAHREYLRSGYPSEPLLAEAAAQQLWTWRNQNPFVVVETLTNLSETGFLNRGELGELTGRQLLLDAYHRAVEFENTTKKTPLNFSAGCRLTTFIKMLFTEENADMVLNSLPDNVEGVSFRVAFENALVCFTHFGKVADDSGVTSTAAWAAFVRHMAIMCPNGHRSVDSIIPVLLYDTLLCEHVMTGMLIRFKRKKAGTVAAYSIDQADIDFFPRTPEECTHGSTIPPYRPYVSLVMELGLQPEVPKVATTPTIFKPEPSQTRRTQTPPTGGSDPATPSKVRIPQHDQRHHPVEGHP